MIRAVPPVADASQRLRRVASLLDQALDDLAGKGNSLPGCSAATVLAEAYAELQSFARSVPRPPLAQRESSLALQWQLKELLPKLSKAQRLLAAAAEFYRGWCAAGLQQNHSTAGYESEGWLPGPVLLAVQG
jgi:hypothetical protein